MRLVTFVKEDGNMVAVSPDAVEGLWEVGNGLVRISVGEFYADVPGDFESVCKTLLGEDGELE